MRMRAKTTNQPSKLRAASSSLVSRSIFLKPSRLSSFVTGFYSQQYSQQTKQFSTGFKFSPCVSFFEGEARSKVLFSGAFFPICRFWPFQGGALLKDARL